MYSKSIQVQLTIEPDVYEEFKNNNPAEEHFYASFVDGEREYEFTLDEFRELLANSGK